MSKRRNAGDWVWLKAGSGFCGESNRLKAEIQPEENWDPCMLGCDDEDCREWPNVWTEPDPDNNNKRYNMCHVSECEMFDEPQSADKYNAAMKELSRKIREQQEKLK
jgi:hypothetical protein